MRISSTARVGRDADDILAVLRDLELAVGCIPGATVSGRAGDRITGTVTARVGRLDVLYRGHAFITSVDNRAHRVSYRTRGIEEHGLGDADATLTVTVTVDQDASVLRVDADVHVRGRIAQLGSAPLTAALKDITRRFAAAVEDVPAGPEPGATGPMGDEGAGPPTRSRPWWAMAGVGVGIGALAWIWRSRRSGEGRGAHDD